MVQHITVTFKEGDASWRKDKWLVDYPVGGANSFPKKKQAVDEAKRYAKNNEPIELIIERKDGSVSKMHKYGFR